jgi:hypothetical protein
MSVLAYYTASGMNYIEYILENEDMPIKYWVLPSLNLLNPPMAIDWNINIFALCKYAIYTLTSKCLAILNLVLSDTEIEQSLYFFLSEICVLGIAIKKNKAFPHSHKVQMLRERKFKFAPLIGSNNTN